MAIATTTALTIAAVTAGAASAIGTIQNANAQGKIEDYNAAVLRNQAKLREQQGKLDANRQRRSARLLKGRQEALFAKAGVALTGSALDVIEDSAAQAELDAMLIEYNAKNDIQNQRSQADFLESKATVTRTSGAVSATSSFLSQTTNFLADNYNFDANSED